MDQCEACATLGASERERAQRAAVAHVWRYAHRRMVWRLALRAWSGASYAHGMALRAHGRGWRYALSCSPRRYALHLLRNSKKGTFLQP